MIYAEGEENRTAFPDLSTGMTAFILRKTRKAVENLVEEVKSWLQMALQRV